MYTICFYQVINYVVTRPAREILFTVTTPEEKYKAKARYSTLSLCFCYECFDKTSDIC